MFEDKIEIIPNVPDDNKAGDFLFIDIESLSADFEYIGLWYARDKNEKTFITTEISYSNGPDKPQRPTEEITENSFKNLKRYAVKKSNNRVWIAGNVIDAGYCGLKLFDFREEGFYLNYRVIKNRANGMDVLKSGIFRGDTAYFARIGFEDFAGTVDYDDTIMYLVLIPEYPPSDWNCDDNCIGIQGLPLFVASCNFDSDKKYSPWNGKSPVE